jgi:hypothetical protein
VWKRKRKEEGKEREPSSPTLPLGPIFPPFPLSLPHGPPEAQHTLSLSLPPRGPRPGPPLPSAGHPRAPSSLAATPGPPVGARFPARAPLSPPFLSLSDLAAPRVSAFLLPLLLPPQHATAPRSPATSSPRARTPVWLRRPTKSSPNHLNPNPNPAATTGATAPQLLGRRTTSSAPPWARRSTAPRPACDALKIYQIKSRAKVFQ